MGKVLLGLVFFVLSMFLIYGGIKAAAWMISNPSLLVVFISISLIVLLLLAIPWLMKWQDEIDASKSAKKELKEEQRRAKLEWNAANAEVLERNREIRAAEAAAKEAEARSRARAVEAQAKADYEVAKARAMEAEAVAAERAAEGIYEELANVREALEEATHAYDGVRSELQESQRRSNERFQEPAWEEPRSYIAKCTRGGHSVSTTRGYSVGSRAGTCQETTTYPAGKVKCSGFLIHV